MEVAVVEVEDTGPGIPEEIREKIFDPFFSTKKDGTGLGLAIAARIIDKHGGVLEFETHHGRGTVFRIVLPAGQREPAYEQSTSH
jgi:signal transduction histidine kinase